MGEKKVTKILFGGSAAGFVVSSLSVLLMPLFGSEAESSILNGYLVGLLFWLGLAIGIIAFISAWLSVKSETEYQKIKSENRPGAISFFKNKYSVIGDTLLICTLILIILGWFVLKIPESFVWCLMFCFLLTFSFHFLLDGRVFRYISGQKQKSKPDENNILKERNGI
mgnify:CR=1 FL=1